MNLAHTPASYSSIHSTNSSPAFAQPLIPPNKARLCMSPSPTLSIWSASHPVALLPRPVDEPFSLLDPGHKVKGTGRAQHTAIPDDLAHASCLEQVIDCRKRGMQTLRWQIDGSTNRAALYQTASSTTVQRWDSSSVPAYLKVIAAKIDQDKISLLRFGLRLLEQLEHLIARDGLNLRSGRWVRRVPRRCSSFGGHRCMLSQVASFLDSYLSDVTR